MTSTSTTICKLLIIVVCWCCVFDRIPPSNTTRTLSSTEHDLTASGNTAYILNFWCSGWQMRRRNSKAWSIHWRPGGNDLFGYLSQMWRQAATVDRVEVSIPILCIQRGCLMTIFKHQSEKACTSLVEGKRSIHVLCFIDLLLLIKSFQHNRFDNRLWFY